jgi:hypothetical protein
LIVGEMRRRLALSCMAGLAISIANPASVLAQVFCRFFFADLVAMGAPPRFVFVRRCRLIILP